MICVKRISDELDDDPKEINKIEGYKEGSKENAETSYQSLQARGRGLTDK